MQKTTGKATSFKEAANVESNTQKNIFVLIVERFIIPIIGPCFASLIIYFIPQSCKDEPTEIDNLKTYIAEITSELSAGFNENDIAMIRIWPEYDNIMKLQEYVSQLMYYHSYFEITNIEGNDIDQSLTFAQDNFRKRNIYDKAAINIIQEIDTIFQKGLLLDSTYIEATQPKKDLLKISVESKANEDISKNDMLLSEIEESLKGNSIKKEQTIKKVQDVIKTFTKDKDQYLYRKNFYDFLLEIKKVCNLNKNSNREIISYNQK